MVGLAGAQRPGDARESLAGEFAARAEGGRPLTLEEQFAAGFALQALAIRKVRQLGDRIGDLLEGRAPLPDVDVGTIDRVWPIVVTAGITLTEPLYDWIEAELPPIYGDARIQSLLVCDPEDLELLLGMVEHGGSLTGLLDARQRGPYRKLELKRWALEDLASPGETRLTYALERWAPEGLSSPPGVRAVHARQGNKRRGKRPRPRDRRSRRTRTRDGAAQIRNFDGGGTDAWIALPRAGRMPCRHDVSPRAETDPAVAGSAR